MANENPIQADNAVVDGKLELDSFPAGWERKNAGVPLPSGNLKLGQDFGDL